MSEQIDWSKAPEDAMVLLKHVRDGAYAVSESYGDEAKTWHWPDPRYSFPLMPSMWRIVAERPTTPSWSGEGLPPVGVVCEYMAADNLWIECEVVAHRNNAAIVIDNGYDCALVPARELRPIRTTEQIESDARIKAAQEWLKSIGLEYGEDVADQCENILMAAEEKRMDKL